MCCLCLEGCGCSCDKVGYGYIPDFLSGLPSTIFFTKPFIEALTLVLYDLLSQLKEILASGRYFSLKWNGVSKGGYKEAQTISLAFSNSYGDPSTRPTAKFQVKDAPVAACISKSSLPFLPAHFPHRFTSPEQTHDRATSRLLVLVTSF